MEDDGSDTHRGKIGKRCRDGRWRGRREKDPGRISKYPETNIILDAKYNSIK